MAFRESEGNTREAVIFIASINTKIDLRCPLTFTLLNILCPLMEKNLIVQLEIEGCYFVFFHLTGHALSPKGEGIVAPPRHSPLPAGEGIKGRGKKDQFSRFVVPRGTGVFCFRNEKLLERLLNL